MSTMSYDYVEADAGVTGGGRIDTTGAYVGMFKVANPVVSDAKGTNGVAFTFESSDGTAEFTLWTIKSDGTKLPGYYQLMDLQLLFGVRGLRPTPGKISKYNKEAGKREEVSGEVFEMLMNKPIGLVLQKEFYDGNKGDAFRMNYWDAFDAKTKHTAKEKKEGKPAIRIDKLTVGDRDSRRAKAPESAAALVVPDNI